MKTVTVEIEGVTPLLIHRFGDQTEQSGASRRQIVDRVDPRQEAEKVAYIAPDGTFYFSSAAIPNAMGSAGSEHKMKGSRKTLRFVVPSAVRVASDVITILDSDGRAAESWEVDSRPVTIPATKGRIMRHRPRWDQWKAQFDLVINEKSLSLSDAHMLLTEAGQSIGIGDYRPEKRGPFGTFRVTRFTELHD